MAKDRVPWAEKEAAIKKLDRGGRVNTSDLIDAARDPAHPCHADFTWDIQDAARERWHDQARALIRRCSFEVIVEDVGTPVVEYVANPERDMLEFLNLRKMRRASTVSDVMAAEIKMLHGLAARVYGIAISKSGIVGDETIAKLRMIKDTLAGMVE